MSTKKLGRNDPCPCGSGRKFKQCHLNRSIESVPNAERDETRIVLCSPSHVTATDEAGDNPLARATANLLQNGQRFTRMAHASLEAAGVLRWFGMFVLGDSGRVVFFPGFSDVYDRLSFSGDVQRAGKYDKSFETDHVTLENKMQDWHFSKRTRPATAL